MRDNLWFSVRSCSVEEARKLLLTVAAVTGLGVISVYLSPFETFFGVLGIHTENGCPLLTVSGIPCPFCGMGRVFSCLTDFYIGRTFYYNPLGLLFYILAAIVFGTITLLAFRKQKIVLKDYKVVWIAAGFLIVMWAANILWGHHH